MGNRAVIVAKKDLFGDGSINPNQIGVYLHWNGGRRSIEGFLKYCKLKGYRTPETDSYGWARLCQVIANFFGGTLSVGIDRAENLDCDNYDNGVYAIEDWEIVKRLHMRSGEQYAKYTVEEMMQAIDEKMPEGERLGEDFWNSDEVPVEDIKIGDKVIMRQYDDSYKTCDVVGIGEAGTVRNGSDVSGVPYTNLSSNADPGANINNYVASVNSFTGEFEPATVRRVRK